MWRNINTILHRKNDTILPDDDNDDVSLANRFGTFFVDKIKNIRNNFVPSQQTSIKPNTAPSCLSSFKSVSEGDVQKVIMASPTKSCSLDPWPTFLVKENLDILLPSITRLVNFSLTEGVFPDQFKYAVVTPLIKKTSLDKNQLKNYRPVSGLCFISKLIERVAASQIRNHLETNNLGNDFQSAYKCGHSTETALLKIKNDIHCALSKGMPTALVLLDLSAAFDTIDHNGLLDCLNTWFGFNGKVIKWFSSYLQGRHQSVIISESLSQPSLLDFGVPQGSVLGPILYSLYTSPLSKVISAYEGIKFHFYADDTQLYFHLNPNSTKASFQQLQHCLVDIQNWMSSNKLKLNPDKTEFILFGNDKQRELLKSCFPIEILGSDLLPTDKVKNLGVTFDSRLTFSDHVSSVCRQCYVGLRDFRRIRRYLTKDTAIIVANALISSRLDYCNSLFRSLSCKDLHRLQCLQNSAARIVTNSSKYCHITPILENLHWLPVKYRCIFKTICIVHKFLVTGLPRYFSSCIIPYTSCVNTRRSNPDNKFLATPNYNRRLHRSKVQFNSRFDTDAPGFGMSCH